MAKSSKKEHRILKYLYKNPRFRGKHIVIAGGQIYVARSAREAPRTFEKAIRANPRAIPTLVYVPQSDTLIL